MKNDWKYSSMFSDLRWLLMNSSKYEYYEIVNIQNELIDVLDNFSFNMKQLNIF